MPPKNPKNSKKQTETTSSMIIGNKEGILLKDKALTANVSRNTS